MSLLKHFKVTRNNVRVPAPAPPVPCRASYVMPSQSLRTATSDHWHAGSVTHVCTNEDNKHTGPCQCACGFMFQKWMIK